MRLDENYKSVQKRVGGDVGCTSGKLNDSIMGYSKLPRPLVEHCCTQDNRLEQVSRPTIGQRTPRPQGSLLKRALVGQLVAIAPASDCSSGEYGAGYYGQAGAAGQV